MKVSDHLIDPQLYWSQTVSEKTTAVRNCQYWSKFTARQQVAAPRCTAARMFGWKEIMDEVKTKIIDEVMMNEEAQPYEVAEASRRCVEEHDDD